MRRALRSAVSDRSGPSSARRLRPGMRHKSKRCAAASCACAARTWSNPFWKDSHSGRAERPSRPGSSATSQPPAGEGHYAPAARPIQAVAWVAAKVLPCDARVLKVQHVQIGGGEGPRGARQIFGVELGHRNPPWKKKPATGKGAQARFRSDTASRHRRLPAIGQSLIDPSRCASAR